MLYDNIFNKKGQNKMQFKALFKKFISHGSVVYTCGSLFIMSVALLLNNSSAPKVLDPMLFIYFALFSFIISLGSAVYCSGMLNATVSRLIHAICYIGGFALFTVLCGVKFSFAAIFTLVFAAVYAIISVVFGALHKHNKISDSNKKNTSDSSEKRSINKKNEKKAEKTYENRFS